MERIEYIGCHNALDFIKELSEKNIKVDCILTDPPYNVGGQNKQSTRWNSKRLKTVHEVWDTFTEDEFFKFNFEWISGCQKILKPNGNFLIFGSIHNMYEVGFILRQLGLRINNNITWFKRNAPPNITCRTLTHSTENIIWSVNGDTAWTFNYDVAKLINNGKQHRDLIISEYDPDYNFITSEFINYTLVPPKEKLCGKHATQKPLKIVENLVKIFTNENDIILDPFMGSGTTLVAAKKLNRRYIGCDLEQEFVDLTKKRLEEIR